LRIIADFEITVMTTLIILSLVSAIAATLIAYVIGFCGRTSATVASPKREVVTKETACQAGNDETEREG